MILQFPLDFLTAPLIADLFLLAVQAIGRIEVRNGTLGSQDINPLDVMIFFITLAYIAISIDASGLIRWLAFKVLQKGGDNGRLLFLYLYAFFFGLTACIGNDPIVLSGTPFLAYMTRVSSNIKDPKAWIFTQFTMANIGSTILVSSNPTNLVLAGAFSIKFIEYTANVVVPVIVTVILLFPFLLYYVFRDENLIPRSIKLHELPEDRLQKTPVNPNIPFARGEVGDGATTADDEERKLLWLEEILNPYLDKYSAGVGTLVMAATLITILALNASSANGHKHPVFWVTLPAAVVMFCWDLVWGWIHRHDTRAIARQVREKRDDAHAEQRRASLAEIELKHVNANHTTATDVRNETVATTTGRQINGKSSDPPTSSPQIPISNDIGTQQSPLAKDRTADADHICGSRTTVSSLIRDGYQWCAETFPTVSTVLAHLPLKLVPFALCMFVLVEALVTKGWVEVFAYGWERWVDKTSTVGAIGGMAFLSVIMCNFAGTNIGTTILLCRVVQKWEAMHSAGSSPISNRTFWATVYSMAIGVNYGAFSTAFSASLAGLLWRDILARKGIPVGAMQFAYVNLRIIAVSMIIGCTVLIGEVYIIQDEKPYHSKSAG